MPDEWNGLADMLADLIEKYASELDIENLSDITGNNHDKSVQTIVRENIKQRGDYGL